MQDLLTFSIVAIPGVYVALMTVNFTTGLLRLWQNSAPKVTADESNQNEVPETDAKPEPINEEAKASCQLRYATACDPCPWDETFIEPFVKLPQPLTPPTLPRLLLLPPAKELPVAATPKRRTPATTKRKAPPRKASKKKSA